MAITAVRAQINGAWTVLTRNASTGKWEGSVTAPGATSFHQSGGYYGVLIEAVNSAGTTATAGPGDLPSLQLVVKETVKPTISITSPGSGAYLTNAQQPILFQLRDETGGSGVNIATLRLSLDGGAAVTNTAPGMSVTAAVNGFDVVYTPQSALSDGPHTVTINVSDNDGNAAAAASRSYTVDTIPPVLNLTNPANGFITATAVLVVQGSTNDLTSSPVTVSVKLNGADQGAVTVDAGGNFSKSVTLAEGSNTIIVSAKDRAGKVSTTTLTGVLDTTVPVIQSATIGPNPADAGATLTISVVVA